MKTPEEKYLHDPHYKALVDSMMKMIRAAEFTPSEVREAAIYACIRYEQMRPRPYKVKVYG